MNNKELKDRIALKELVDKISILADEKNFVKQVQLFSENAVSETIANGKTILKLKGRDAMVEAFSDFSKDIQTVYHFNGQHLVNIYGDKATGTSYCLITMIGLDNGQKVKTNIGASYQDDYVRVNDSWLIAKRIGNFEWQEKGTI